MTRTLTETTSKTFEVTSCCVCDIEWAVPDRWLDNRREDGQSFYCPNGHILSYNGDRERLKRKAKQLEEQLAAARRIAQSERERTEREKRSHAATKGQLTKTRKRIAHGVCPKCNRTFENLARHMATKHEGSCEDEADS